MCRKKNTAHATPEVDEMESVVTIQSEIDSIGILQAMWITQRRSQLRDIMRRVKLPTVDNLRKAGMVNVSLAANDQENEGLSV
jgi:hypothetical protein